MTLEDETGTVNVVVWPNILEKYRRAVLGARLAMVRGRVQQVGFRAFVLRRAGELRLSGNVRNTADGAVEVVASGPGGDLDRLEGLLRAGPPLAIVAAVESTTLPEKTFPGFQVLA